MSCAHMSTGHLFLNINNFSAEHLFVILVAGEENNLMFFGTFFDKFAGFCGALRVHIGERVIENDNSAAIGE